MILYNITVNIDNQVKDEWFEWMVKVHIPDVMKTKAFHQYKMFKLLNEEENGGTTYCIQYFANTMWDLEDYQENYAKPLQMDHYEKFKDKFVIFRTVLEMIDSSSS